MAMDIFISYILQNLGEVASILSVPLLGWLIKHQKSQDGALLASLRIHLRSLHDRAKYEMKSKHRLDDSTRELFWTGFIEYENLGGNGRVRNWAEDFKRWEDK
jgi:hypothetical protein